MPFNDSEYAEVRASFTARFENIPEAVCWLDATLPHCPIVVCNPAFERIYGFNSNEIVGCSIHALDVGGVPSISATEDAANRKQAIAELRLRGITFGTALHRRKDGRTFPVEYSGRLAYVAGHEFIQSTSYPVNTAYLDGSMDEATRRLFHMGFGFFEEGVVLVDLECSECPIVECNEAFAHMNGYLREELIGRTVGDFGPAQDPNAYRQWRETQHLSHLQTLAQIGKLTYKGAYRRKDGSVYPCQVLQTLFSAAERSYMLVVVRPVHDLRKQALELIAQSAPLHQTLTVIARMVESEIGGAHCIIYQTRTSQLSVAAGPALRPSEIQSLNDYYTTGISGPAAEALALQNAIILASDVTAELGPLPLPFAPGSYWAFPILMQGQPLGILEISFTTAGKIPWPAETACVETAVAMAAIAIDHTGYADRLTHQAQHDYLTGLPNRLLLEDRLQHALPMAKRRGKHVGVLFLDLDGFKRINDTLGHAAGDMLLKETGRRLNECVRKSDTVGRLGGDEFMVVLTAVQDPNNVDVVAAKILHALQRPFKIAAHELFVTTSIGTAIYPQDGEDAQTLQRNADAAMYRAKHRGKNRFERYNGDIGEQVRERFELKIQLQRALSEHEFEVFYQPQLRLSDYSLYGLEAFIRWQHPTLGLKLPSSFIPVAEESGIILRIGTWMIEEVCRQMQVWRDEDQLDTNVNVNISSLQFSQMEFSTIIQNALEEHGVAASRLQLDLTEGIVIRDMVDSARQLNRLRDIGIGITVDHFGTGYSSLSYMKTLPINTIKIGRTFVEGVSMPNGDLSFVKATVQLAHSLNLTVISEGIESWDQIAVLRELECDVIQGYAIAKPMPASEVVPFLEKLPLK